MAYDVTWQQLVDLQTDWYTDRPHVVILGAGASLAAFPNGDAVGRQLPLMANLVDVVGLRSLVKDTGHDPQQNFESLYSSLHASDPQSELIKQIRHKVAEYFEALRLPQYPTVYDLLLLSLREKDAVLTFNWDPLLVDAYERNWDKAQLPHIFHLHGNVSVGFCAKCETSARRTGGCPQCDGTLTPTQLLYPVENKDYSSDPFLSTQWDTARKCIREAAIITIFGYSAPSTDKQAAGILNEAWNHDDRKPIVEHVEVINVQDRDELAEQWKPFAFFDHYNICRSFYESRLAHYPRRTCEALGHQGVDGQFVEPIPWAGNLHNVHESVRGLVDAEKRAAHTR